MTVYFNIITVSWIDLQYNVEYNAVGGHPYLVPRLRRNAFNILSLSMMFAVVCFLFW